MTGIRRSGFAVATLALLVAWSISAATPAVAQTVDYSWCLAEHTGEISGKTMKVIWPGTGSTGRYALVTVTIASASGVTQPGTPLFAAVRWTDSDGEHNVELHSGNSATVWAQSVEVLPAADYGVAGEYTITFNLCDCNMRP